MKKYISLLLLLAVSATAFAQINGFRYYESPEVRATLPTQAQKDSASYLLGVNFGMMIKQYGFGTTLDYSEILQGMKEAAESKGSPDDDSFTDQFKISPKEMSRVLDGYLEIMASYTKARNLDIGEAYAEYYLKNNRYAKRTESGLVYCIIKPGDNRYRASSDYDTVTLNYEGRHIDGTLFDSGTCISFPLNRVIAGFCEGLKLIGKGGKIELVIPGYLAYGEKGRFGIQPNETLLFVIEILDVERN